MCCCFSWCSSGSSPVVPDPSCQSIAGAPPRSYGSIQKGRGAFVPHDKKVKTKAAETRPIDIAEAVDQQRTKLHIQAGGAGLARSDEDEDEVFNMSPMPGVSLDEPSERPKTPIASSRLRIEVPVCKSKYKEWFILPSELAPFFALPKENKIEVEECSSKGPLHKTQIQALRILTQMRENPSAYMQRSEKRDFFCGRCLRTFRNKGNRDLHFWCIYGHYST